MSDEEKKSNEYRVVYDGGQDYFATELGATSKAERLARLGIGSDLETRNRAGALWRLKLRYEPVRGGQFRVVDPYRETMGSVSIDTDSLQGRIA